MYIYTFSFAGLVHIFRTVCFQQEGTLKHLFSRKLNALTVIFETIDIKVWVRCRKRRCVCCMTANLSLHEYREWDLVV